MIQPDVLRGYAEDSGVLIPAFEALRTTDVLAPVEAMLPSKPSRILEVGAGTGRDASWMAERGHTVVAVEPVRELREAGIAFHPTNKIRWVDDRLPDLSTLRHEASEYDLILVIGVWQHLPPDEHEQAIITLGGKLTPDGCLVISLRHGPGSPTRPCFPADTDRVVSYAENAGLRLLMRCSSASVQQRNRERGVTWTWLCFVRS